MTSNVLHLRTVVKSEQGHALPSILLLITVLSLMAACVLSLLLFQHQQALRQIGQVKAEYAAQSGIAMFLARSGSVDKSAGTGWPGNETITFEDGSEAEVSMEPWGVFRVVRSVARSGKFGSKRIALVAVHPPDPFAYALVFANVDHELVFAGSSSITGDVLVGRGGVTTGSLKNALAPTRVPVAGNVTELPSPPLPKVETGQIQSEISACRKLLSGVCVPGIRLSPGSTGSMQLDVGTIPDSVQTVHVGGNVSIVGTVVRRERRLLIAVSGRIELLSGAVVQGLICLFASQKITLSGGVNVEHAMIVSEESVELEPGSFLLGQVVSPFVQADSASVATYPSAIISFPVDSASRSQKIRICGGARIDGVVVLTGTGPDSPQENIIEIEPRALVIGAVYSDSRATLHGTVIGTVFTKDFYFYEAPTQYLGWVRNGLIDRPALPTSFLVPTLFSTNSGLDILDWL